MTRLLAACAVIVAVSGAARADGSAPPNRRAPRASAHRLEPYTFSSQRGDEVEAELGHVRVPENRNARHDFLPVATAALEYRRGPVGSMMGWATICASGVSPDRLRELEREAKDAILGAAVSFPFPDACAALPVRPLGREFRSPLRSDVPALFISGSLDGETPPRRAEEVARGFSRGSSLIVPGARHGFDLFYFRPEVKAAMLEFLATR